MVVVVVVVVVVVSVAICQNKLALRSLSEPDPSLTIVVRSLEETNSIHQGGGKPGTHAGLRPTIQRTDRQKDDAASLPSRPCKIHFKPAPIADLSFAVG